MLQFQIISTYPQSENTKYFQAKFCSSERKSPGRKIWSRTRPEHELSRKFLSFHTRGWFPAFLLLPSGWKFLMPRVLLISRRIGRPENQLSSGARVKSVDGSRRHQNSCARRRWNHKTSSKFRSPRRLAYSFGSDSAGSKNAQFYRHQANKSARATLGARAQIIHSAAQHQIYANSGDRIHLNKLARWLSARKQIDSNPKSCRVEAAK